MFSSLLSFLELRLAPPGAEAVSHDDLRMAVAALLVEMARADFNEDEAELDRARELLGLARSESDHTVSLFRFTHLINQHLEMPDKLALMAMLWDVAYADGRLDKHEDALMHKLSDLLYVPLADLMAAKQRAQKKMRER